MTKPTIAELEHILNGGDGPQRIEILPSGEIRAVSDWRPIETAPKGMNAYWFGGPVKPLSRTGTRKRTIGRSGTMEILPPRLTKSSTGCPFPRGQNEYSSRIPCRLTGHGSRSSYCCEDGRFWGSDRWPLVLSSGFRPIRQTDTGNGAVPRSIQSDLPRCIIGGRMSAPVEFRSSPLGDFPDGPKSPMVWTWESTVAIDLRWVASAQPTFTSLNATQICMAGSRDWITIDIPYPDFMKMWTDHMEKRT